ncbi:MAG: sensor domain-containing diguanylate cyclase [Colwellia sp.]|nr:sensor domain-containing diguanylate cyclase [Colwellia sp.]
MGSKQEISQSESLIRRLYEITTQQNISFDNQVQQLLELGCERFKLDIGILAKITGKECHLEYLNCANGNRLKAGDCFDLSITYSEITLKAKGPVAFEHVKQSAINKHPAYLEFQLESYIGIPIKVNNKIFGTLNFSSLEPYDKKFSHVDIDALQLMAIWVGHALALRQTSKKLKTANEQLEQLIRTDVITGLYNRNAFQEIVEKQISLANRNGYSISIVKLNLERFNPFKGKYGQLEADKVLTITAGILIKKCRSTDIIANFGGEEFVIALINTDQRGALKNCDSLTKSIKDNKWQLHNFTAKCGVSTYTPSKKENLSTIKIIEQLLKEVDSALFHSKSVVMN